MDSLFVLHAQGYQTMLDIPEESDKQSMSGASDKQSMSWLLDVR